MNQGAVIFDFNGVLVDDESVHFQLFQEVLAEEGVQITPLDYHERYLGYDDRRCFEAALQDAGKQARPQQLDELVARKAARYVRAAERGLRFFPGAALALDQLSAHWPIAICSGALRAEIQYGLGRLERLDRVSAIISAEDAPNCKPHPQGYLLALEALRANHTHHPATSRNQLHPDQCLVIEDSLAGIISAKTAGMNAIGITNTYSANQLLEAGADEIVDNLSALTPDWIRSRFGL